MFVPYPGFAAQGKISTQHGLTPLRYVSVAFGTYCLLAGLGAWYVFSLMSRQLPRARRSVLIGAGALVLLAGAAGDYRRFRNIFVRDATPDLSIRMLRESRDR